MEYTAQQAAEAARNIGVDLEGEKIRPEALAAGMAVEAARHGTKDAATNIVAEDPVIAAKLALANLRVSPNYYSPKAGVTAWEKSLARGAKQQGRKTEYKNWPERPKSLSERGYRKYMARQKKVTVNGTEFTLQSVSPSWYYETNDECGNTGSGKRKSAEYMDRMFKNCVIAPAEVRNEGMAYFDEKDDLKTPEGLIKAIENFLRE